MAQAVLIHPPTNCILPDLFPSLQVSVTSIHSLAMSSEANADFRIRDEYPLTENV